MTKEEKLELASIVANAVVSALKETNQEKGLEQIDVEALLKQLETKGLIHKDINNKKSADILRLQNIDIGLSLYGFNGRILSEEFIQTYSSGKLKDYYSCFYFLNREFLKENSTGGFDKRIQNKPAYFTYFELSTPVINPLFVQDGNNILSVLLDIPVNDLKSIINYEKYVITKSNEQYWHENDIVRPTHYYELTEQNLEIEFATGSKAIQHLLSNFDLSTILQEVKKKYTSSEKNIPQKVQRRIKVLEYFIYNKVETQKILISILPVPQINMLLRNATKQIRTEVENMYLSVASMSDRVVDLVNIGAPDIIINNQKRLLQLAVARLFRKCLKVYLCHTQIQLLENIEPNELDSDFLISEHKKEIMSLFGISKESDLYAWVHFISMLFCMEINVDPLDSSSFFDFLWEQNAIEDRYVWDHIFASE